MGCALWAVLDAINEWTVADDVVFRARSASPTNAMTLTTRPVATIIFLPMFLEVAMTARAPLGILIAVACTVTTVAAQESGSQLRVINVEQVRDNLFVLHDGGANSVVFVSSMGVVLVDTKVADSSELLLDAIRSITDKPIITVINTNADSDHVGGNAGMPARAEIIAQRNTRNHLETADKAARKRGGATDATRLPTRTFRRTLKLFAGADEIDLYSFGRGHTNGDAWVVFPALRVAVMSDLFPAKTLPQIDAQNGGSAYEIPDTLTNGYNKLKNVDTIVTGHGGNMTRADLKEYIAFNEEFLDAMWSAQRAGRNVTEVTGTWEIPLKYADYVPTGAARLKNNATIAYKELSVAAAMRRNPLPDVPTGPEIPQGQPQTPPPTAAPAPEPAAAPAPSPPQQEQSIAS